MRTRVIIVAGVLYAVVVAAVVYLWSIVGFMVICGLSMACLCVSVVYACMDTCRRDCRGTVDMESRLMDGDASVEAADTDTDIETAEEECELEVDVDFGRA